jgi:hypothetical protein
MTGPMLPLSVTKAEMLSEKYARLPATFKMMKYSMY